ESGIGGLAGHFDDVHCPDRGSPSVGSTHGGWRNVFRGRRSHERSPSIYVPEQAEVRWRPAPRADDRGNGSGDRAALRRGRQGTRPERRRLLSRENGKPGGHHSGGETVSPAGSATHG